MEKSAYEYLHAHFMCKDCGAITDVEIKEKDKVMGNLPKNMQADDALQRLLQQVFNQ